MGIQNLFQSKKVLECTSIETISSISKKLIRNRKRGIVIDGMGFIYRGMSVNALDLARKRPTLSYFLDFRFVVVVVVFDSCQ